MSAFDRVRAALADFNLSAHGISKLARLQDAEDALAEIEHELRARLAACERQEPVAVCVSVNEWTTEPRYVYPADDKNPPAGTKLYANPLALREPSYEECELICSAYNSQSGITHMGARMFNAVREVMT